MEEIRRSVFRPETLRRYTEGRDRAVLPRWVSPHTFVALWVVLGLLAAAGGVVGIALMGALAGG